MLHGAAMNMADNTQPQGCLIVQGALSCSEAAARVKEALISRRVNNEQKLKERFDQAKTDGDLPTDTDTEVLARYLGTVLQGMAIQANNGATSEQLRQVAQMTLLAFPGKP